MGGGTKYWRTGAPPSLPLLPAAGLEKDLHGCGSVPTSPASKRPNQDLVGGGGGYLSVCPCSTHTDLLSISLCLLSREFFI